MKVVIKAFRGGPSVKDAPSMKISTMRGKVPWCKLSANTTEVSVAELLFMPKSGTDSANKILAMLLGGERRFELGDFNNALGIWFTGVSIAKGSKCIG
jgi:hypothetical protein